MMEWLNNNPGLISMVGAIAAISAAVIPIFIYRLQRKNERIALRERKEKERQDLLDELGAMNSHSPFPMSEIERLVCAKREYLQKRLSRLE